MQKKKNNCYNTFSNDTQVCVVYEILQLNKNETIYLKVAKRIEKSFLYLRRGENLHFNLKNVSSSQ